jgi:glutamate-1-semialdehyde aminotransferase
MLKVYKIGGNMSILVNDSSTTSKRSIWPDATRDLWVIGAVDSRLRLSNGLWYDDWASALGANTLGYDRFKEYFRPAASLPWADERGLAERFCEAMGTEAVRFFKSGSDAVSCAVRLARAYTGREPVIMFKESYHGTANEFMPIAWHKEGYVKTPAIAIPFGKKFIKANYSGVAAIIVEPVPKSIELPPEDWLQHLREVCDEHGILLISDEVILGYRHTLSGYMSASGVRADLLCYGKAMGQGAAISACTGRREVMDLLSGRVHFSGTNNGSPTELAIASATLDIYRRGRICEELAASGGQLRGMLKREGFETRGLDSRFEIVDTGRVQPSYCFERGVLFPGWVSMAITHTVQQMERLVHTLCKWREDERKAD